MDENSKKNLEEESHNRQPEASEDNMNVDPPFITIPPIPGPPTRMSAPPLCTSPIVLSPRSQSQQPSGFETTNTTSLLPPQFSHAPTAQSSGPSSFPQPAPTRSKTPTHRALSAAPRTPTQQVNDTSRREVPPTSQETEIMVCANMENNL